MIIPKIMHAAIALSSLYLFALFAWWWSYRKSTTKIYQYTCLLMFGIFFSHVGALNTYCSLTPESLANIEAHVPGWLYVRLLFILIPLLCYVNYSSRRIYKEFYQKTPQRRATDLLPITTCQCPYRQGRERLCKQKEGNGASKPCKWDGSVANGQGDCQ